MRIPLKVKQSKAPAHLNAATRRWFRSVAADFVLDQHHVRLLTLACESWDRGVAAREAIAKHGLTFTDRFGAPRARPEVAIARDSSIGFARLVRELGLGDDTPDAPRPPMPRGRYQGRK
jgi:P27 family predicted phage terminase small subunit